MDQDDLEDEVFTKTILAHVELLSTSTRPLFEWQRRYIQTELLYALALVFGVVLFIAQRKRLLQLFSGSLSGANEESCEQKTADAAVFALKGRRQTMEDRFALVQIPVPHLPQKPIVRLFAVLDGHGGHFAAVYVKKHLIDRLTAKIKVLKLLTHKDKVNKEAVIKTIERLLSTKAVTKGLLEFVGMSLAEYKRINPNADIFENQPSKADKVVMSPRVKPIEELSVPAKIPRQKIKAVDEGHAHNDMLSPYSNVPTRGQSQSRNSPRRQESVNDVAKDIHEYLSSKGEIHYPELLSDEIAKVDETLLKACKKEGQVGGTTLLLSILDEATLWVANVGDSRGVMKTTKSEVIPLSYDHKPSQLKEKKRVEEAGGYVSLNGVWRVQGVLATSRALGDYPLKDQKVIVCEPDILSFQLDQNAADFAILASDGLWDTHSNEEAANHVEACFKDSESVLNAARSLARDAYTKGSTDNVSVMVLNLKNMF